MSWFAWLGGTAPLVKIKHAETGTHFVAMSKSSSTSLGTTVSHFVSMCFLFARDVFLSNYMET